MKKNYLYGAAFVLAIMGTACNNAEDFAGPDAPNALRVSVVNNTPESRAIITGTTLPVNAEIGVTLVENVADATTYDTETYSNLKYTTADGTNWAVDGEAPLLSSTEGKAIAYFPYGETVNYKAIALTTDDQIDNMYSGWVTGINNSAPEANFTMNHAKSAFRVVLKKDAKYGATAIATSITAKSAHFVETATLDATKAAGSNLSGWSTGDGEVTVAIAGAGQTLDTTNDNYTDIMVIPAENAGTEVLFTIAIKDANDQTKNYTVTSPFTTAMEQGKCYQFTLTLTATGFEVSSVAVTQWGDPIVVPGDNNLVPETPQVP